MGAYVRNDFSQGWMPSADAFNCPKNVLLRMDNLTLDELGAVALRQGSAKINSVALSSTDCHSLFTLSLSGIRHRMTGATDSVFDNGTSIASGINGSGDIQFGAQSGHILFARGTTKKKYDGTTVRNWGIAALGAAPMLVSIAPDSAIFATCASTESPAMVSNEGSQTFTTDRNSVANAAVQLAPNSTTGRAMSTKTFSAPMNFSTYTNGLTATDEDIIDFYAYYFEPQLVEFITLQVDVNDGTFNQDWYDYNFTSTDVTELVADNLAPSIQIQVTGTSRTGLQKVETAIRSNAQSAMPGIVATALPSIGWNHFNVARGNMQRHGGTAGRDWNTVKAVRIIAQCTAGGAAAAVIFDDIQILGGSARPLTGTYAAIVVAVRDDGTYQALSGPSATSSNIIVKAQGIKVVIDNATMTALDSQVNQLWVYIGGGHLENFFRAAVATAPFTANGSPFDYTCAFETAYFTSVSGQGGFTQTFESVFADGTQNGPASYNYSWEQSQGYTSVLTFDYTINVTSSEVAMIETDLILEEDNVVPPDNIIGIEGPHYDRTMALTAQFIYPSRELDPDAFGTLEAVRIGDNSETGLWIKKLNERLYVGTTRDVYFMDGDWAPQPDGSVNVAKRPLGVTNPPISGVTARGKVNGVDQLVYLSSAGWCTLGGTLLTDGSVDLLWRGYTRHGVSPVNLTSTSARFGAAISKNVLFAITPEGTDTTSSATIHAYHFAKQKWYRYTYPQAFRSIYAEPDGTLIAGDASGFVRTIDSATKQDDGANISVTMRTGCDDNGQQFNTKDAQNLLMRLYTAGATATIAFHLDGSDTADNSTTTAQGVNDIAVANISNVSSFTQMQLRITGSFSDFLFRGYQLGYLDSPQPLVMHDTGFVDLAAGDLVWLRRIWVKANTPVDMTVTPYFDGTAGTVRTLSVGGYPGKTYVFPVPLGREDKGRTVRLVLTSTSPSQVYYVQFEFSVSGKQRQKIYSFKPDVAA